MTSSSASPCQSCIHRFYLVSSIVLLVFTLIGFRLFYLEGKAFPGRPLAPPIFGLVVTHGVCMTAWMLLSVAQPLLITLGKRRLHMALGRFGAVLALIMFIVGWMLAIPATRISPPQLVRFGLPPLPFMAIPTLGVTIMIVFIGIAIWQRRRSEIHRPLMLMATLSGVSAALGRIPIMNAWSEGTTYEYLFSAFGSTTLLGAVLIGFHFLITRRVDRWLCYAFGLFVLSSIAISLIAHSSWWLSFATWLTQ